MAGVYFLKYIFEKPKTVSQIILSLRDWFHSIFGVRTVSVFVDNDLKSGKSSKMNAAVQICINLIRLSFKLLLLVLENFT